MLPIEALTIVVGCVLLLLLGAWLWLRRRRLRDSLWAPLVGVPQDLVFAWADALESPKRARGTAAGSSDRGQLCIVDVLFQLSRLDRSHLSRYRPSQFPRSFDELMEALSVDAADYEGSEQPIAGPGEQRLAEQLRRQGFDVQLEASEKTALRELPGWIALIDGHPVRLIGDLDVVRVRRFVERNPEAPVVTLGDYAQEFIEYAQVWALEPVTRAHLQTPPDDPSAPSAKTPAGGSALADSAPMTLGGLGSLVAGRTLNPMILTAFRGAQMAAKRDKDWLAAATGGIVDQAGASVGGWAGARAGSLAGALFGPIGAAAGGFVGNLLGKQVGQGIADGQKQKKLRKLQAKQNEFAAQLPLRFSEALAAQAVHLSTVAVQFDSLGILSAVFPTPATLLRAELAAQYRAWRDRSLRRGLKLTKWLRRGPSVSARAERGRKLVTGSRLAWSPELLELRSELVFLQAQIDQERDHLILTDG